MLIGVLSEQVEHLYVSGTVSGMAGDQVRSSETMVIVVP
jgi:hypothetical protein